MATAGFSLHAGVAVEADRRGRGSHASFAQRRTELIADARRSMGRMIAIVEAVL